MPRTFAPLQAIVLVAALAGACVHAAARVAPAPVAPAPAGGASGSATGSAIGRSARDSAGAAVSGPAKAFSTATVRRDSAGGISASEVTRETVRVFGDSAASPGALVAPGVPVWDIDVQSYETRARVQDYVRIFTGRAKGVFATALQRQTQYGPMIRRRLRAAGLPEDLTYLALVESWFNPHAYSRAAAVGFWQFMAGTARWMGLRVDWWMDERRDPVRSTEAAARLLVGLRSQFGSLYLAAAAYNGGSGRVSRGLARYPDALAGVEGEDRFFALAEKSYLRPETRNYVPKIIAAALVGEEPARYGVVVESLPPYAFDSVYAPGGTPLAAVANAVGVAPAAIAELNPALLRGMTPPSNAMWVRVPVGSAAMFAERLDALEPAERRALTRIESKKGQSMASIARAHGLTAKQLGWFNPKVAKLKSGNLRAGQGILVPRRDVAALARDVPNPSIEKYPSRRRTSGARRAGAAKAGAAKAGAKKPAVKSAVKSSAKKPTAKKPTARKPAAKPAAR